MAPAPVFMRAMISWGGTGDLDGGTAKNRVKRSFSTISRLMRDSWNALLMMERELLISSSKDRGETMAEDSWLVTVRVKFLRFIASMIVALSSTEAAMFANDVNRARSSSLNGFSTPMRLTETRPNFWLPLRSGAAIIDSGSSGVP